MNIDPYKATVEITSTIVMSAIAVCLFLAVGLLIRVFWEGLRLGFTIFGYWPV